MSKHKNNSNNPQPTKNQSVDVDMNDVEAALESSENEFAGIEVELLGDTKVETPAANAPEKEAEPVNTQVQVPSPEEKVTPPVVEEPKKDTTIKPDSLNPKANAPAIKVGDEVTINKNVVFTLDRRKIPNFAYSRVFKVTRIIPGRIFITNKAYTISVNMNDVTLV